VPNQVLSSNAPRGVQLPAKRVGPNVAPLSGEVLEVNQKAVDEPEVVNEDPYGEGWLIRIRMSDTSELDALMSADAYRAHVAEQ